MEGVGCGLGPRMALTGRLPAIHSPFPYGLRAAETSLTRPKLSGTNTPPPPQAPAREEGPANFEHGWN